MAERGTPMKRQPPDDLAHRHGDPADWSWYAYAVVRSDARVPAGEAVLPGIRVDLLRHDGIGLLTSLVAASLFDSEMLEPEIADPDWVAARAQAHHALVVAAAATGPCLPFAFGTVFRSLDQLGGWLDARARSLADGLDCVADADEWIIALHEDTRVHAAWLGAHDPDLQQMQARARAAEEGLGLLLSRRLDRMRGAAREARRSLIAARIATALDRHARTLCADGPYDGCWTALLARGAATALRAALAGIAEDIAETGLAITLSGPWPPYGFACRVARDDA